MYSIIVQKQTYPSVICIHSRNGQGLLRHSRPKRQMAALLCLAKPYQMSSILSMVLHRPSGMGYVDSNKILADALSSVVQHGSADHT